MIKFLKLIAKSETLQKIAFKVFCHRLQTINAQVFISTEEKMLIHYEKNYKWYLKEKLAIQIMDDLIKDGFIEYSEEEVYMKMGGTITAKLYAYKK